MTKVLTHMCISRDGVVAQADDNPAELFDWYWGGDIVVLSAQAGMSFSLYADPVVIQGARALHLRYPVRH